MKGRVGHATAMNAHGLECLLVLQTVPFFYILLKLLFSLLLFLSPPLPIVHVLKMYWLDWHCRKNTTRAFYTVRVINKCIRDVDVTVIVQKAKLDGSRRRRSGWTSGGDAWRAPKVSPCRVGWGMGRSVPSPAD